jgi:4-aminobutyrate aminotransferase
VATIKLLRESLVANAAAVGAFLQDGMRALMDKHALIGDVRGKGLMIGVELVKDRVTKERAIAERDAVVQACFYKGLLVLGAGRNAIRLSPPLTLTRGQAETAIKILDEVIGEVAGRA